MTKPKKVTDAWLRNLKYRPLESKGLKVDGAISKRTGKPMESRPGQLLPNRYPDERGMYVNVAPTGRVTFRYSYRWPKTAQGRRQLVTYGDYPILSFEKARDQHIDFQRKLRDGINPLEKRRIERQQITAPADFRSVAVRWYEKNKPAKSDSWKEANARYLEWAYPYIGTRDIRQLTARDISAVITPIENSGRKVAAEKTRQCYAMVLDYAADKPEFLLKPGENAARALSVDLPNTKHHAHLQIADVAPFLKAVDADSHERARLAVRLLFLTLTRKMELIGAKWAELDLDAARWQIPAERMKGKALYIVPLSNQATAHFRRLKEWANGSEWVFPHPRHREEHMGGDTVNHLFNRVGYKGRATPHGCRSTTSSTLNELGYSAEHVEKQLAHNENDEVRVAYMHADFMPARRKLLQDWADAIDRLCAGLPLRVEGDNVVKLHAA